MELSVEDLSDLLTQAGGPTPDGLKKMLIFADTLPQFESDEAWEFLCEFALEVDAAYGITDDYMELFLSGRGAAEAMLDNYVLAALAACKLNWKNPEPLMAYAASNKHEFVGFAPHGLSEISCMRILHWGEWDINAPLPNSLYTALHKMVYLKYRPGTHPRCVQWLLEHGADVHARNAYGDTPIIALSGCDQWYPQMTETFKLLLLAGAAPLDVAKDGSSALSLLNQLQSISANSERGKLIKALETDIQRNKVMSMDALEWEPAVKWQDTLALKRPEMMVYMTS
ncbi:Ankyrin repeat-containing protein [Duganella sacchari]|uniref:Ankyrin repeat-containing protein n=1 Tax=Duganella sacchari TaxID=551987 RepID=A0A1M7R5J9_9BURK|nr:ankyrin repeat domain-containing protein [Duganella sacchari]SHN40559.1 Ankyrin repeat-containing protein [Duganella sacchari]